MPGSPELSASSRSRHSAARTSPTRMRLGRIRSASLTRSRRTISPVCSSPACRVCIATQSGWLNRSSKTSSALTTRSPPGIDGGQAVEHRRLAGLRPAGDEDVEPGAHGGLEEGRRLRRQAAEPDEVGEPVRAQQELADVDRGEAAGDPLEHDVEPVTLRQHRVDEGRADVDAPPARLEHPLDQLVDLRGVEPEVGQLVPATARDEDPLRGVDPHLLDLGVVEEGLQRAEAGDPGDQLADHRAVVGDRRHGTGEAELVVVADDVLGDAAYDERLALRVDALAADALAHLAVEAQDEVLVGMQRRRSILRQTVHCHWCLLPRDRAGVQLSMTAASETRASGKGCGELRGFGRCQGGRTPLGLRRQQPSTYSYMSANEIRCASGRSAASFSSSLVNPVRLKIAKHAFETSAPCLAITSLTSSRRARSGRPR